MDFQLSVYGVILTYYGNIDRRVTVLFYNFKYDSQL